jgi:hypothetical protein
MYIDRDSLGEMGRERHASFLREAQTVESPRLYQMHPLHLLNQLIEKLFSPKDQTKALTKHDHPERSAGWPA